MDIQQFERLLMRYERLAGCADRLKRLEKIHQETLSTLITSQEGNGRRHRELQAALAKIEEWEAYYSTTYSRLTSKQKAFLDTVRPATFELEIPF